MAVGSIQDKLNRVRKPRVHIIYDVETEGAVVKRIAFRCGRYGRLFWGSNRSIEATQRPEVCPNR